MGRRGPRAQGLPAGENKSAACFAYIGLSGDGLVNRQGRYGTGLFRQDGSAGLDVMGRVYGQGCHRMRQFVQSLVR